MTIEEIAVKRALDAEAELEATRGANHQLALENRYLREKFTEAVAEYCGEDMANNARLAKLVEGLGDFLKKKFPCEAEEIEFGYQKEANIINLAEELLERLWRWSN